MPEVILAPIVEGHGEVSAFSDLLRRMGPRLSSAVSFDVKRPWRLPKSQMLQPGKLALVARRALDGLGEEARLIVLLDADDDCPAELAPTLLARELNWVRPVPAAVVVAKSEYESWFVACADSLFRQGKLCAVSDSSVPTNSELIRGAKEWIASRMPGRDYRPTRDQASFSAALDIELARSRSDSFDKLYREVKRLLTS